MSVSAKFKVQRVTPNVGFSNTEVELVPDYAEGRNKDWAEYTPSGLMRLQITNPAALEQFQQGRAFTVTFEAEDE